MTSSVPSGAVSSNEQEEQQSKPSLLRSKPLLAVLLVLLFPLVIAWVILYLLWGALLYAAVWLAWCSRGRDVLFVYSDSPIWRDYLVQEILPVLEKRAVILNWSDRKRWNLSLAALVHSYFSGGREFNPLAMVFKPFRWVKSFKFYKPFQDFKHGRRAGVEKMKNELLAELEIG